MNMSDEFPELRVIFFGGKPHHFQGKVQVETTSAAKHELCPVLVL